MTQIGQIGVGTFRTTDRMRELINAVLDSGRISYGPMSRDLEAQFAALHDCSFGVLSNSGTSSLQVALETLKLLHGWQDGDEVLVPAITFVASVNVVLHARLTPVLVDVEPDYYGIDPTRIEAAITPRTRAIMPVHVFGQPCAMDAISTIATQHGLQIIEDSCECMFVGYQGRRVGSWGAVGCFSTYVAHLITTGVGGIATTSDPDVAATMRSLVNHGRDGIYIAIDDDRGLSNGALREVVSRRFRFNHIGHSFRITELEAALGLAQLADLPAMIATRQENAQVLTAQLAPHADRLQLPAQRPHAGHAWMMYPIVLRTEDKADLVAHLERRGIETRDMLPLTTQPAYAAWCDPTCYPVAGWINRSGFYIGCHQDLADADLWTIMDALEAWLC